MKRIERRKLKEDEFARTVATAREVLQARRKTIIRGAIALGVAAVLVGGFFWWRQARESRSRELLASALTTYATPVVKPEPPAPGSPPPVPRPGTFQSERERLEASLPKFLEAADASPGSDAAVAARFHAAGILAALGRHAEADQQYRQVIDRGSGSIYGRTARLGLAQSLVAQEKFDEAIEIYTELSRETNSTLPIDSVLLQLGRAYAQAGKKEDAIRSFTRIVDEFPQSPYAADAQRAIAEAKKS